ncbi:MAG TPA: hypothetical protein VF467_10350 [Afipia sp.]
MRFVSALSACVFLILTIAAHADTRVFIIANQPDGYGIDDCLAKGARCGMPAAQAYCQSREFAQASSFRRINPDEVTGAVPASTGGPSSDGEYVAITCQR